MGQCVSEMRTSPVMFCHFLKDIDVYPIFLFDPSSNDFVTVENHGQCVSLIRVSNGLVVFGRMADQPSAASTPTSTRLSVSGQRARHGLASGASAHCHVRRT